MTRPSWAPDGIDLDRPSGSRIYDYFNGGMHNFEIDRDLARQLARVNPVVPELARANRQMLRRVVRYLVDEAGVGQFLDLGSGIPTVGNVHEIAQASNPGARVVYVDIDPVAVAHSRIMLEGNPNATVVTADIAETDGILGCHEVTRLLDFDKPIAVLLMGVLHFLPDSADPGGCIARLQEAVVSGSYLALTHVTSDRQTEEFAEVQRLVGQTDRPTVLRSRDEIGGFFHNWPLLEPGLVDLALWRPDDPDAYLVPKKHPAAFGAMARKR